MLNANLVGIGALTIFAAVSMPGGLSAQENYEIHARPCETMPRRVTMLTLHSNYTFKSRHTVSDIGEIATNHALHETAEISRGFNDWSELGFYWLMAKP